MGVENLALQESQTSQIDKQKAYKEESDRLFGICEAEFNLEDAQGFVDFLEKDLSFSDLIKKFQSRNGELIKTEIIQTEKEAKEDVKTVNFDDVLRENITSFHLGIEDYKSYSNKILDGIRRFGVNEEPLLKLFGGQENLNKFMIFYASEEGQRIALNSDIYRNIINVGNALQIASIENNEDGKILANEILTQSYHFTNKTREIFQKSLEKKQEIDDKVQKVVESSNGTIPWAVDSEKISQEYFEREIKSELKNTAKEVLLSVLKSNGAIETVANKNTVYIPFGEHKIRFDFGDLPEDFDIRNASDEQIKAVIEKDFENIYIDDILEKIGLSADKLWKYANAHPEKFAVDVGSIVISGIIAGYVGLGSGSLGAGVSFTVADNVIRGTGYGLIGKYGWDEIDGQKTFGEGFEEGVGLENTTEVEKFTKKSFELVSNIILFKTFKIGGELFGSEANMAGSKLADGVKEASKTSLGKEFIKGNLKTIPEATFFTGYTITAGNLEEAVLNLAEDNDMSYTEIMDIFIKGFDKFNDSDTVLNTFMYNMGFISLVKLGTLGATKGIELTKSAKQKFDSLIKNGFDNGISYFSKQVNREILSLENMGYKVVLEGEKVNFYDKKGEVVDLINSKDFAKFNELQKQMADYILHFEKKFKEEKDNGKLDGDKEKKGHTDPQETSGNGTGAKARKSFIDLRYQSLTKISKETGDKGLPFVLDKKDSFNAIKKDGLIDGTIKSALIEAQFSKGEREGILKDMEALKTKDEKSKDYKDRALEKLNVAVDKITREYTDIKKEIKLLTKDNKDPIVELKDKYSSDYIKKILEI